MQLKEEHVLTQAIWVPLGSLGCPGASIFENLKPLFGQRAKMQLLEEYVVTQAIWIPLGSLGCGAWISENPKPLFGQRAKVQL